MTLKMTTISFYDRTEVSLSCEPHGAPPAVQVRVLGAPIDEDLLEQGGTLFVEQDPERSSSLATTIVVHGGSQDAHVWDGSVWWSRDANGYCRRTYTPPADAIVQVVALTTGSPPPAAPPEPGSGQAILKVKVRKKGDLPL